MDWMQQIDGYCERTDFSYWSEPVNAVTNAAFLIAAFVMWRRTRGTRTDVQTLLIALLAAIGVGSYLFHTHATVWAAIADVVPIGLFILVYIYAANRDFWSLHPGLAGLATILFIPYAAVLVPWFQTIPWIAISAAYWPVPLLIAIYGVLLLRRHPATGRGLLVGAAILVLSLIFRSADELPPVCMALQTGTHPLWHLLNGVMLGWMIEVHRRHVLRAA